jgi:hypothetical protein
MTHSIEPRVLVTVSVLMLGRRWRPSNQLSNNHHPQSGHQRTSADDTSQVRHVLPLAAHTATWLRDEEATLTMHTRTGTPAHAAGVELPNLAVLDQGGAAMRRRPTGGLLPLLSAVPRE